MNDLQSRADRLLSRCFNQEELAFLRTRPEFIAAEQNIKASTDVLNMMDVGQSLVRAWKESLDSYVAQPRANPFLKINWREVRLISFDETLVTVVHSLGQSRFEFASRPEMESSLKEWVQFSENLADDSTIDPARLTNALGGNKGTVDI